MAPLSIYWKAYAVGLRSLSEYRADFAVGMLTAVCTELATLAFYWTVFANTHALGAWSSDSVLLLFAMTALISGTSEAFLNGIWGLPGYIVTGDLDRMLLYPVDSLTFVLVTRPAPHAFGTLATAITLMGVCWARLSLPLGMLLLVPIWAVSGAIIYTGALVLAGCACFRFVGHFSDHFLLIRHILDAVRYPLKIYPAALQIVLLTILPLGIAVSLPAESLLGLGGGHVAWAAAAPPLAAMAMGGLMQVAWRRCVRRYQGTGS